MFDKNLKSYDKWRLRIRYHFIHTNQYYMEILDIIEKEKNILNWSKIWNTRLPSLPNLNWPWIATHIWNFVGRHVSDTMLGRMEALAQGKEFNGVEVWRALYLEFIGSLTEMSVNERQ